MSAPQPPPPIPQGHPLRDLYESERQSALIRLAALNRALGYADGTARERRERARGWRNENQAEYEAAS